ncbi:hypothetical protein VIGAN_07030300, partial [Vigna angularis var. angularis]
SYTAHEHVHPYCHQKLTKFMSGTAFKTSPDSLLVQEQYPKLSKNPNSFKTLHSISTQLLGCGLFIFYLY